MKETPLKERAKSELLVEAIKLLNSDAWRSMSQNDRRELFRRIMDELKK